MLYTPTSVRGKDHAKDLIGFFPVDDWPDRLSALRERSAGKWWGGVSVDVIDWICVAIAWLVTCGSGAVAILCGRLPFPWRRSVAAPRMWGVGALSVGLAATVGITTHGRSYAGGTAATCLVITGLCLMAWAERPGTNG